MGTNIRVSNTPIYTGNYNDGIPSYECTQKRKCDYCGKVVEVPSSYLHILSDFDKAEFCSFNCRFAYYKKHAAKRADYMYKNSWQYKEEHKKENKHISNEKYNEKKKARNKRQCEYDRERRRKKRETQVLFKDYDFMKIKKYKYIIVYSIGISTQHDLIKSDSKHFFNKLLNCKQYDSILNRAILNEEEIEDEKLGKTLKIQLSFQRVRRLDDEEKRQEN